MVTAIQQETEATMLAMRTGTDQVESGVAKTELTGAVLESIRGLANQSGLQASQIAASAQQQTAAVREIHTSIDSMANFVEQVSLAAEQNAGACQSFAKLAADLNGHSERFRLPGDAHRR
jgi:methyl-accepting chemotaxis protein